MTLWRFLMWMLGNTSRDQSLNASNRADERDEMARHIDDARDRLEYVRQEARLLTRNAFRESPHAPSRRSY